MSYDFFENPPSAPAPSVCAPKREYTAPEAAFAWACVIIGFLICFAANSLQVFLLTVIALVITAFMLYKKGARFGIKPCFFALLSFVFSFSSLVAVRGIEILAFVVSFIFFCAFVYTASGNSLKHQSRDLLPLNFLRALKSERSSEWGSMLRAMFSRGQNRLKSFFIVLLGLFVAIIPTLIVATLLSYDEGFAKILENGLSFVGELDPFSFVRSLILGTLFGMYVFGIYSLNSEKREPCDVEKKIESVEKLRCAPALFIGSALFPLTAVYIIFFVSQWQYYVSGFSGVLPQGVVNYAEYARSGFFELCTVSGINFAILAAAALLLKRESSAGRVFLKVVSVLFSLMTLVLIGTAMAKMALYIDRFGLTVKRVLSSWFMVLLAMIFVIIILKQFINRLKLFSASATATALMLLVLLLSNYTGIIADYNVNMYVSDESQTVSSTDVVTLVNLDDSAVPALVRLAEFYEQNGRTDDPLYERIVSELEQYREEYNEEKGAFSFSFPEYRAKRALEDYYAKD